MLKAVVRIFSFASKELDEVRRQPRLIASLILGPFLILLLFGVGYSNTQPPLHTVLVIPKGSGLSMDEQAYQDQFQLPFILDQVIGSEEDARHLLETRQEDVALILAPNARESLEQGHRAEVQLLYHEIDPVQSSWIPYFGRVGVSEVNRQLIEQVVQSGRVRVGNPAIPTDVLVAPLDLKTQNLVPYTPSLVAFYTPGVLALLLQHLAVTLASLSIVRERLLGALEVFHVAPVGKTELFFGKYLGYGLITLTVGVVLIALMTFLMGVPILGSLLYLGLALVVLVLASLSIGFLISTLSKSESQAVQFSMILLLASIFFSGFFLPLSTLLPYVRSVAYVLPVTYGIKSLQEVMLLGRPPEWWVFAAPLGICLVTLFVATRLLQRDLVRG